MSIVSLHSAQSKRPSGTIFLVMLFHQGLHCWHVIDVSRRKEPLFRRASQQGNIALEAYGTIIESGWGTAPPTHILEKYNLDNG